MDNLKAYLAALGRLLMSSLFIWGGIHELMNVGGTAQYFAQLNVPFSRVAVWVAIVIELIGGLAILIGFRTRYAALVLALWCLFTAFVYHLPAGSALHDMIMFYKNLVMAGGFLYVMAYGAGRISIDTMRE